MATATKAPSLTKAQERAIGTYSYNFPETAELDAAPDNAFFTVSIFSFQANKAGDALKHASSGVVVRGLKNQHAKVLKTVKVTIKELTAGTFDFGGNEKVVVYVPTGRPRGRAAAAA